MRLRNLFRSRSSEERIKGSAQWRNKIIEEENERNVRESGKNYGEIRITKWWSGGNVSGDGYEKLEGEKVVKETAMPWGCHDCMVFNYAANNSCTRCGHGKCVECGIWGQTRGALVIPMWIF
ncbi:hypothetical protein GLAREA_05228 [Glarea lozoyensis ATCC 20868]|uniref:RanBP2-type domain-containing protein n=1 Tax=Glarea lozoyensis (strain ATCC 20868 / MF5171) TaxID=1116229 RepID=S3DDS2_GLAL2|nr:uncharacterized protein GLAREA_05228 [Glarea lozoyensis ATCC 20868]EPE35890.1 hypothetical protein GLAREA_05228 [Glarea lozoyensis ATCC 20868]